MIFNPKIQGTVAIQSTPPKFLESCRQRVTAGLLAGHPQARSHYEVSDVGPTHITIHATDWPTAFNVGLNELELQLSRQGSVHYQVRYWRWARYALALGAALGIVGVVLLLSLDVRGYIGRYSTSRLPGLTVDQNVAIAWFMALFWGFIWPWLLIPLHKRPLRGLVERLITEVDLGAMNGHP
jgi:hypothetical protein